MATVPKRVAFLLLPPRQTRERVLCRKKARRTRHAATCLQHSLRGKAVSAVDSCGCPTSGCPTSGCPTCGGAAEWHIWKGFNAGFFAADCRLENCGQI